MRSCPFALVQPIQLSSCDYGSMHTGTLLTHQASHILGQDTALHEDPYLYKEEVPLTL
jgi:hypothetical protein